MKIILRIALIPALLATFALLPLVRAGESEDTVDLRALRETPLAAGETRQLSLEESLSMTTATEREGAAMDKSTVNESSTLLYTDTFLEQNEAGSVTSFERSYQTAMSNSDVSEFPQAVEECCDLRADHSAEGWTLSAWTTDQNGERVSVELSDEDRAYFQTAIRDLFAPDPYGEFMRAQAPPGAMTVGAFWPLPTRALMDALDIDRSVDIQEEESVMQAVLESLTPGAVTLKVHGKAVGTTSIGGQDLDYRLSLTMKDVIDRGTGRRTRMEMKVGFSMFDLREVAGITRSLTVEGVLERVTAVKYGKSKKTD